MNHIEALLESKQKQVLNQHERGGKKTNIQAVDSSEQGAEIC